jgi:hypothetical protein
MFERYSEDASRTIILARGEAYRFGSPYIETEAPSAGIDS